jgi:hypothetical protein
MKRPKEHRWRRVLRSKTKNASTFRDKKRDTGVPAVGLGRDRQPEHRRKTFSRRQRGKPI